MGAKHCQKRHQRPRRRAKNIICDMLGIHVDEVGSLKKNATVISKVLKKTGLTSAFSVTRVLEKSLRA